MSTFEEQLKIYRERPGFVAALDHSGGSTPKALAWYGIDESAYANDAEMFDLVHEERTRIITSTVFNSDRIISSILFEDTLDRDIAGKPSAVYLWEEKGVVPILKIDKGLEDEADGVQLLKPIPGLAAVLEKAADQSVFGTKMRSVIQHDNEAGIKALVAQQFELAREIIAAGMVPIVEPEVHIGSPEKAAAETILEDELQQHLDTLEADQLVILKLTLPEEPNLYQNLTTHPNVVRVVALSGGYDLEEATTRLAANHGMIASFSQAFLRGLRIDQTPEEFDAVLDATIEKIYQASIT